METAREHVRVALQLLLAPTHGSVHSEPELEAVDSSLQAALMLLEPRTAAHTLVDAAAEIVKSGEHFPIARRLLRNAADYFDLLAVAGVDGTTYTFRITAAGLEALTVAPVCQYCGCTDVDPCEIPRALIGADELPTVAEYFAAIGEPVPEIIPCSWLDVDDAVVCSAPSCAATYAVECHR